MIEINEIFSDSDERLAFWFDATSDTSDLAIMAEDVIKENIKLISVAPESVSFMWACLEKTKTKIMARYKFYPTASSMNSDMYDLVKNINGICKKGANGVQVFIKMSDMGRFVDNLFVVRDDLFFQHDLSIGLDINDVNISDWDLLFQKLRYIRANSLILTLGEDMGNRSDFVGRVYSMLEKWDFDGQLHFVLNNDYDRMDQVIRLVEILKPQLSGKLHFFLNY